MNSILTRRTFATRFASMLSALGVSSVMLSGSGLAQSAGPKGTNAIRKLNDEGKPASEKEVIMPIVEYNGLLYISGQGAHDTRDSKEWTIESHTTNVMDKIKKLVEAGGGSMDSVLQQMSF